MLRTSDGGWPLLIPAQWNFTVGENATPTLSELNISADALQIEVGETTALHAQGHYSDGSVQDLNAEVNWTLSDSTVANVDANGTLHGLSVGVVSVTATYEQTVSNALNIEIVAPAPVLQRLDLQPELVTLRVDTSVQMSVTGHYSDGSSRDVTAEASYETNDTSVLSVSNGDVTALATGTATVTAILDGIASNSASITVFPGVDTDNFPPDAFAYNYKDSIPNDAVVEQYDPERFCMITGRIYAENGQPLAGVKVSLFNHDEYGTAYTDESGIYVLPIEGGVYRTVRYSKTGFTTIDRTFYAAAQDWENIPDVMMLPEDTKVTTINLADTQSQTHISTPITDDRGTRSTTLVFDGVHTATVTSPGGAVRELSTVDVRATEFKTPASMPAELPQESAYTYCSDLKIDGTDDGDDVVFDAPVVMYVNNFLGFEVGEIVPVGYYDRNEGKWKASDNGVVVALLDTDNDGRVDALDSTGDGQPNDIDGDGDTADEAVGLADETRYQPGSTMWRAAITHFTPWDHNWPYGPPADAQAPDVDQPTSDNDPENDCKAEISSYVTQKSRSFHEDIPVAGTDITLHYATNRVEGYKHIINASVDTSSLPASIVGATVTLEVAGKTYTKTPDLSELDKLEFVWDGKDVLGKHLFGVIRATLKVDYKYNMVYYNASASFEQAWAQVGESPMAIEGRSFISFSAKKNITINVTPSVGTGMGVANGWSISSQDHIVSNMLVRGNGVVAKAHNSNIGLIDTVAGNGNHEYSGDGGKATEAGLSAPLGIALDNKGNLFIADSFNQRVRKVDANGIITTVAGDGTFFSHGYYSDGSKATEVSIDFPVGLAFDNDGNLYISDQNIGYIRKVNADGIITTVAGNGNKDYSGDGGKATEASLHYPYGIALDGDGNLYIADYSNCRIRKVNTDGIITTVAGNGDYGYSGDGGKATEAQLSAPQDIALDSDGNLYIADTGNNCIRKVDTEGIITTVAGNGDRGYSGDGGKATDASLYFPYSIAAADNILYIADSYNRRIRKVDAEGIITTVAGNGDYGDSGDGGKATDANISILDDITVDSNGKIYLVARSSYRIRKVYTPSRFEKYGVGLSNYLYRYSDLIAGIFDSSGKQLRTINLNTGKALQTFGYDEQAHLTTITDQFDQTTTITRDANGYPTLITAPNGQETYLGVDAQGDLTEVRYENGSSYAFTYFDGSLMNVMTDPNGNQIRHYYDENGRITEEVDGENGSYRFLRTPGSDAVVYQRIRPEGETQSSRDILLENGDTQSLITLATDDTLTAVFTKDGNATTSQRDGVSTIHTYTTDPLTYQDILASTEITQPSDLKKVVTYTTSYEGNTTYTHTKTQTISVNDRNTTIRTDYDSGTQIISTPTGRTLTLNFDTDSLVTNSIASGSLTPTVFSYDAKGRLTAETTGTRIVNYTYDARGNVATTTDANNRVTSYTYDIMDRLSSITYPDTHSTHFTYDANGNMTILTVPTPADHSFAYNGVDKTTSYTSPLDKVTAYAYDKSRKLTALTRPSGKQIIFTYANGRMTQMTRPENTTVYTYLFADKPGSVTVGSESFTYGYDGELLTSITQAGTLNQIIGYTYNNNFLPESITYAGAAQILGYDNDGLLTQSGNATISRDGFNGLPTQVGDGTFILSRTFNGYADIQSETAEVAGTDVYGYEITERYPNGQIRTKVEILGGVSNTYGYTYDDVGRLTEVTENDSVVEAYDYDANGNRVSATSTRTGITYVTATHNVSDQLVTVGSTTYAYDDDGFLASKIVPSEGTTHYSYGTLGELKSVVKPDGTIIEYAHNANNQRVSKTVNGTVTEKYLWLDLTTLLAVYDGSGNLVSRFEYADSRMPYKMTQGGETYYLNYDQVGTLRTVATRDGTIVKTIEYDTFGNVLSDSNPSLKVPFGFAGGLYDPDTKLTRFGYRDYDAETGKWTAKDPIGFNGGDTNLYGYVFNEPVNIIDIVGLAGSGIPWRKSTLGDGIGGRIPLKNGNSIYVDKNGNIVPSRSLYDIDITKKRARVPNRQTDVKKVDFEANLEANGFCKAPTSHPDIFNFEKGNSRYSTRPFSKSERGATADYYYKNDLILKLGLE